MNTGDTKSTLQVGSRIRHTKRNIVGTVTAIHAGEAGQRLVEWKHGGQWEVSSESVLEPFEATDMPWRRKKD